MTIFPILGINIMRFSITLIALIVIWQACNSQEQIPHEEVKTVNESPLPRQENIATTREEEIRNKIDSQYHMAMSDCPRSPNAITDFNQKTEFWSICISDSTRILKIHSHSDNAFYEEIYLESNDSLVYAEESVIYMPINSHALQTWKCQFYIQGGKLATLMSLGHGKTEDEDWNPDEIFAMHAQRLKELALIKTE